MQMTAPLAQASAEERTRMCKAVYEEIHSQQARIIAATERAKQVEHSRNALLARDLKARKAREAIRPCLADRLWEKAVNAYAVTWAVCKLIADKLVVIDDEK